MKLTTGAPLDWVIRPSPHPHGVYFPFLGLVSQVTDPVGFGTIVPLSLRRFAVRIWPKAIISKQSRVDSNVHASLPVTSTVVRRARRIRLCDVRGTAASRARQGEPRQAWRTKE